MSAEILFFNSESEWESEFSGSGNRFDTKDSGETVVPRLAIVQPINDRLAASFTFLGRAFPTTSATGPGRYFIESYDSVYVSAFPSSAWRSMTGGRSR